MNNLNQIKHNLKQGLPIDSEEVLAVIGSLEQERDDLNEAVANLIDLLKAHRSLFSEEGFIESAIQCDDVINDLRNQVEDGE